MSLIEQTSTSGLAQAVAYGTHAAPTLARQAAQAERAIADELRPSPAANTSNKAHGLAAEGDGITPEDQETADTVVPGEPPAVARPNARSGPGSLLNIVV